MANCGQRSRMTGSNMSIDGDELWTTAAVRFQLDLPPGGSRGGVGAVGRWVVGAAAAVVV
eukprot:COSAG01_NODE_395_length_17610_cov_20.238764_1_plen_59_part_10